jgi:cytochrome c biogenesis protein CcmG, thiol:disulfide interchange protein DsbE
MISAQKRRSILVAVLLVVAYGLLRFFTSFLSVPSLSLPSPHLREPFAGDFALPDVQGKLVRLSDFRGQPVLINFWATWCPPCRREMPSMQALYEDFHRQGLVILAVASDAAGAATVAPFMQAYHLRFPILLDPENTVGERLRLAGLPTTYLLDRRGRISGFEVGARNWNSPAVRRLITQLLAEEPGV